MPKWENVELSFSCDTFRPRLERIAEFAAKTGMEGAVVTYIMPDGTVVSSPAFTPSETFRKRKAIDKREIDIKPLLINSYGWRLNTLMTVHSHPPDTQLDGGFPRPSVNDLGIDRIVWGVLGNIPSGVIQLVGDSPLLTIYAPESDGRLDWQLMDLSQ